MLIDSFMKATIMGLAIEKKLNLFHLFFNIATSEVCTCLMYYLL